MSTISQIVYDTRSRTYRVRLMDSTGAVIELRETFDTQDEAERHLDEALKKIDVGPGELVSKWQ